MTAPAVPSAPVPGYPIKVLFTPAGHQSRLTIFFRLLLAIPALIVAWVMLILGGIVTIVAWFTIVILGRFPSGMFSFAVGVHRWETRVQGYVYLMTSSYPPFSLEDNATYPVRYEAAEAFDHRNRLTTFFRVIMVIPHAIILWLLAYAAGIVLFIAWLIGIFAGQIPSGLHNFLAGYLRWWTRFQSYYGLITDRYPPFSMSEDA